MAKATDRCLINTLEDALLEQIFSALRFEQRCSNDEDAPPPSPPPAPNDTCCDRGTPQAVLSILRILLCPAWSSHTTGVSQVEGAAARMQAVGTDPEAAFCGIAAH